MDANVKPLVVLTDTVLRTLASNPELRNEFPVLAQLLQFKAVAPKKSGCGACNRNRAGLAQDAAIYNAVRQQIVSMGDARRRLLKTKLNTKKIQVSVQDGKKLVKVVF